MAYQKDSPAVPDSALSASSRFQSTDKFGALQARLFKENHHTPIGHGSWVPGKNNKNEYFQVDLGRLTQVSGIVTMGRTGYGDWVKQYYVSYSNDGMQWDDVMDGLSPKVCRHKGIIKGMFGW